MKFNLKNLISKLFVLFISLLMLVPIISSDIKAEDDIVYAKDLPNGSSVYFGNIPEDYGASFPGEAGVSSVAMAGSVEWIVIDNNHEGYPDNSVTLLSKDILATVKNTDFDRFSYSSYADSAFAQKCDDLYEMVFDDNEKSHILNTSIIYGNGEMCYEETDSEYCSIETMETNLFLLSNSELLGDGYDGYQFDYLSTPSNRIATLNDEPHDYVTRSSWGIIHTYNGWLSSIVDENGNKSTKNVEGYEQFSEKPSDTSNIIETVRCIFANQKGAYCAYMIREFGIRPAMNISGNTPLKLNQDGVYVLSNDVPTGQSSSYSVLLPKQVDVTNNSSSFDLLAKGSIKSNEILNVSLDKHVDLVDQTAGSAKDNVTVSVDQSEFNFFKTDLSEEYVDGGNADKTITLTHDTLTAGDWSADLNITIKLNIDESKKHSITYDPDGGTMPDTYPTEFYEGDGVTDLPIPTKDGHEFIGWYKPSDPDTIVIEIPADTNEDVELIAKWESTLKEITLMQGPLFSNAVEDYFPNAKKIIFVNEGIPSDILNDQTPILSDDMSTGLAYGYMDDDGKTLIVAPEADNMTMYAHRNAGLMFNIDGLLDVEFVNFDTSRTDNMQWMFYCDTLRSISGYENWDVSNVTTMIKMFQSAHDLDGNLDFSKWNTSSLTNIDNMFEGCISLDEIDLSGWNIKGVNSLNSVFDRCNNLMYIDLSTWDARNVTSMIRTFTETDSLEYIKTPYNLNSEVSIKLADNLVVTDSTWYDTDDSMREYPAGTFPLGIVSSHKLVKDEGDVTYNIHYESIDDLIMPDDYPTSYKPGDTFDLPVPEKTGTDPCDKWEFVGWITRDDETITKITPDMTGDISIVASWTVFKNYNCSIIQYDPNGGSLEGVIEDDIPNNQVYDNYFPKYEGLLYEDFATPINESKDFYGWFDISPAKVTIRNEDDKIQIVGNGTSLLQHYLLDDGSSTHRLFIDETDVRPVNSLEHLILINGTATGADITDIKLRVGDDDNVYSLDKLSSLNGKYLDLWFIVPKGETFELSFHSTIGDAGNDTSIMPRIDQETFMEYGNIDPIVKGSDKDIPGGYLYRVRAHWDPFTSTAIDASEVVTGMVDEGFEIVYSRMMKTVSNFVDTLFSVDTEVFDNSIDFVYTLMCDDQSQSLNDETFNTETNIGNAIEGNSIEIEVSSQTSEDQISSGVEDLPKEEIGIDTTNDVSEDTTTNLNLEQSK